MRSSQDPNLCILSHEIMAMRYKLYECIKEGNIDKNGLSNFDLLNILIEEK